MGRKKLSRMSVLELFTFAVVTCGRWAVKAAWRYRAGLTPFFGGLIVALAGWGLAWFAGGAWPMPAVGGIVLGAVLWFAGAKLSDPVQQVWLALVPDALDDGKAGVLDRPTERGYLTILMLTVGSWLSARMLYGWTDEVRLFWLGGVAALGVPWWWHRGFRRRKPLNVWARRWRRVEGNPDLKEWHGSRVTEVTGTRKAVALTVKLRPGSTVRKVGGDALVVCSALGLRPGAVTVALDKTAARRVVVRVVPRDPWKGALIHPLPALDSLLISEMPRPVIGRYEDSSDAVLKLAQHHLVVGATGSGKSIFLESLLTWILAFRDARVVAADLASGATFGIWEDVFAAPLATNVEAANSLLDRVFAVVEHREGLLAQRKRAGELIDVIEPSPEMPWLFVFIDEFPDLIKGAKSEGLKVLILLERLAAKARKTGVWLIFGAQNPTADDVGSTQLRGALTSVIGLGLDDRQSQTLWGSGRAEGWDSRPLTVGTFLLRDKEPDHQVPRVAKGLFVPPSNRLALINAAARQPRLLERHSQLILGGNPPAVPLGETSRSGWYENAGTGRPALYAVRDLDEVAAGTVKAKVREVEREDGGNRSGKAVGSRREKSDALDASVLAELPPAAQAGVGATELAAQLDVDRNRVNRSLARLRKRGLAYPNNDGTWSTL